MNYDLRSVSFSRAGSILSLRITPPWKEKAEGFYLQIVPKKDVIQLNVLRDGTPVEWDHRATPSCLVLNPRKGGGRIEFAFESATTLRIKATGVALSMEMPTGAWVQVLARGQDRWQINHFGATDQLLMTRLSGKLGVDAPWDGVRATHAKITVEGEIALETFPTSAPAERERPSFAQCRRDSAAAFDAFLTGLPAVPARYRAARELAGYILWAAIVAPHGHYRRPAMLMSKNGMMSVWSWDHCFNSIALSQGMPKLAWDQMLVMFDHQDAAGALPDCVSTDKIVWNFCKPPIHGWALRRMLADNPRVINRRQLAVFYPQLAAWTNWWMRTRDDDGDGICQYHHGNDSGWDNATCFAVDMPVEGPDLAAFLVTQMDTLALVARRLGRRADATRWQGRADRMLRDMIRHCWRGDRFVAMQSGTHRTPDKGDSLIPFAPLILGRRLPPEIARTLVAGLFQPNRFLTRYGLATENPKSARYESDGYWRGPIWAPSTYIIYDGLRQLGEHERAREVARRFCEMCRTSGFAENFDALTGRPLRDKAYTWTASVFLLLAQDLWAD
jgi:hypothetical protein